MENRPYRIFINKGKNSLFYTQYFLDRSQKFTAYVSRRDLPKLVFDNYVENFLKSNPILLNDKASEVHTRYNQ